MADTGPLLQLAFKGPQDAYLYGDDFSHVYTPITTFKRATRAALEVVERVFPRGFILGKLNAVDIPLGPDVLGATTLEIRLPRIPGASPLDTWAPSIGYALLRRIRVYLNETTLVDKERLWCDLSDKLFVPPSKRWARDTSNLSLTEPHTIHVDLHMPWSKTNFFPTVALPGVSMILEIDTERFDNCIVLSTAARADAVTGRIRNAIYQTTAAQTFVIVHLFAPDAPTTLTIRAGTTILQTADVAEGATSVTLSLSSSTIPLDGVEVVCDGDSRRVLLPSPVFPAAVPELNVLALFECAFLDVDERHAFLRSRTVWMYETAVDMEAKSYRENVSVEGVTDRVALSTLKINLSELNHPVRALVWVVYPETYSPANYFQYVKNGIVSGCLFGQNQQMTLRRPAKHYQLCLKHGNGRVVSAADGIHLLSFAMDLTQHGALSGSLAFDKIRQPFLEIALAPDLAATPHVVKVFAIVRRVLMLYKGRAQFVTL